MSPETFFVVTLVIKVLVGGVFVIGATIAAERGSPLLGGLVATLPVSAGPGYVFLALDHTPDFVSAAALTGLVINAATAVDALIYTVLAQRIGSAISLVIGLCFWLGATFVLRSFEWSPAAAAALNVVVFTFCFFVARPYSQAHVPQIRLRWTDIAVRAGMVAAMIASVVTLSSRIGPSASAVFAGFPVVYTSMMLILGPRIGTAATGAVIANSFLGLAGFGAAILTLHMTAVPLGSAGALSLALAVSIAWNLSLYVLQRQRASAKRAT